jgi:hypothetical protein
MAHFLIEFDRVSGASRIRDFSGEDSGRRAMEARFQAEDARASVNVEVVVLQAESEDDLRRTHSRYFEPLNELVTSVRP